jgi:hypothetical protein
MPFRLRLTVLSGLGLMKITFEGIFVRPSVLSENEDIV